MIFLNVNDVVRVLAFCFIIGTKLFGITAISWFGILGLCLILVFISSNDTSVLINSTQKKEEGKNDKGNR